MGECHFCGAPIERATDHSTKCRFCGRTNEPLPREVQVPVPVQLVHNVVHVVRQEPTPSVDQRCPHCHRRLQGVVAKGVELRGCGRCGGIWIDNVSACRVLDAPEDVFGALATRAGTHASHRRTKVERPPCPECGALLERVTTYGIDVDVCPDHGTWFDAFEVTRLIDVLTGKVPNVALGADDERKVLCATCRRPLRANRANITDQGLLCDPCWSAREAEIAARGDAFVSSPKTVGGVLLRIASLLLGGR